ncbi:DUF550 domain-containing protein [Salmonella enterica]|nr:DUF550 domain-containing protein [Salmonella enterica]EGI5187358.1 DUF550 domain-containing protein [Salmonella enterica subsp. enterica serovar Bispebjerg]
MADAVKVIDEVLERRKADRADAAWKKFQSMLDPDDPAAPQPAPERDSIRREHAEWSDSTFGNVGPIGPLKHLSKEALEAAADPSDPLEWADMQFLLWDAQRRMGISDEFITRAMVEKLAINKGRQWPEPKDGEPRMHIKEDAPQLSGNTEQLNQAPVKQPASNEPVSDAYKLPAVQIKPVADLYEMQFDDGHTCAFHTDHEKAIQWLTTCDGNKVQEYVKLERYQEAMAGNYPATPDGYVMVPVEPTAEMQSAAAGAIRFNTTPINKLWTGNAVYRAMIAAAPQQGVK